MAHSAKVIEDSICGRGDRLTTLEVKFPRIVLAEFNTHRVFSRNSASSRAIPIQKMIQNVLDDPYIPSVWGKNGKGMVADGELLSLEREQCKEEWLKARDHAVESAQNLLKIGLHKEITNRILEPFMWHTVVVTATNWDNYFNLRLHPHAHPDIRLVSVEMKNALNASTPKYVSENEWHLPFIQECDRVDTPISDLVKISVGRCARVSYLTHDGRRDLVEDIKLHDTLLKNGHMSPFEHVASPMGRGTGGGMGFVPSNFSGWIQYRKTIRGEDNMLKNKGGK